MTFVAVKPAILASYVGFCRDVGAPVERLLKSSNLPVYFEELPNAWLPYHRITDFVENLLSQEPESELALSKFPADPSKTLHPAMWRLLSGSGSLYRSLERLEEYSRHHISHFRSSVEIDDEVVRFKFWLPREQKASARAAAIQELRSCQILVDIIRWFAGSNIKFERVFLKYASNVNKAALQENLGDVPVLTSVSFSGVEFCKSFLSSAFAHSVVPKHVNPRDDSIFSGEFPTFLSACLEPYLMEGHPTISLAAEIAGMSTRTLQRQLSKAGMPYEQLVDQLRCRLALRYLEEHDASLAEIAFNLGYSEQSAFSRAFTRWTGISPRDHRRNLQANAVN